MPENRRGALLRLALVVVAGLVVAYYFGALATVLVVLALIVMIVLHEFGHFVMAKLAGMKVSEFFVGFGPVSGRSSGARLLTGSRLYHWVATAG